MKKSFYSLIFIFIFFPMFVKAETLTFNVCKDGCEYSELSEIEEKINNLTIQTDVIINIKDNYLDSEITINGYNNNKLESVTINGESNNINYLMMGYIPTININNININTLMAYGAYYFDNDGSPIYEFTNQIKIENSSIDNLMAGTGHILINKCKVKAAYYAMGKIEIEHSSINGMSLIGATTMGPGSWSGNVHIYSNNKFNNSIKRIFYSEREIHSSLPSDIVNTMHDNNYLIEVGIAEHLASEYNILPDKSNNIYIYQETNKTIESNTNISELETDFKNTYENSEGYDDIKDLPIVWKSENESIATLENGIIKPIANGQVDLVGTRGNDIYTIHLTVDMPAKKTNEKKIRMAPSTKITLNSVFKDLDTSSLSDDVWEISNPSVAKVVNGEIISLAKGETDIVATINGVKYVYHLTVSDTLVSKEIKVPITGKNIKLWIIVVTILLLSVIGACSYILIKKK